MSAINKLTHLIIFSLWKAAHVYLITGQRPEIRQIDAGNNKHAFVFLRTPETEAALVAHQADEGKIKSYGEHVKLLRSELYLLRDRNGCGND